MKNNKYLTLREVCAMLGVSRRVVQGYEKAELIAPAGKNRFGRLLYDRDTANRIVLICFLQRLRLPLREIGPLLELDSAARLAAVRQLIRQLQGETDRYTRFLQQSEAMLDTLLLPGSEGALLDLLNTSDL